MAWKYFLVPFLSLLLLACADDASDTLLTQPPFKALTDSMERDRNNAGLYVRRGTLLFQNNHTQWAKKDLQQAWKLAKEERTALRLLQVLGTTDAAAAEKFNLEAIAALPQSIALQVALAENYGQQKAPAKALATIENILAVHPGQIDALLLKWQLLKGDNRTAEAMATLENAYTYAPFDAELAHNLAYEYAEAKNSKVLALADSLIKADSLKAHAEPFYFKGLYYANVGNTVEAINQFDAAIRRNYNFLNAYINKGIIYYEGKKYNEAMKTFHLATTIFPTDGEPYYWLAKTKEATGNKEEAKLDYQRAYGFDKSLVAAKEAADRL